MMKTGRTLSRTSWNLHASYTLSEGCPMKLKLSLRMR